LGERCVGHDRLAVQFIEELIAGYWLLAAAVPNYVRYWALIWVAGKRLTQ
jgi:hypothetical protein